MRAVFVTLGLLLPFTVVLAFPEAQSVGSSIPKPDASGKYTLTAPGIRAQFVPYGAGLSNLFVKDKRGIERDIVLGWENATFYTLDPWHDHYGGVPGRYANRIRNATFTIDNKEFKVDANEHGGLNQLHGGSNGWDWRNFTVLSYSQREVVFGLFDKDGEMGFPGDVSSTIKYRLEKGAWEFEMRAKSLTKKTPIMLSSHVYWNLDGFANPGTEQAYNHVLHLPLSGFRVGVDGILIPTGDLLANAKGSVNDFWSAPKAIGKDLGSPDAVGNCGTGCTGYDNAFIVGPHNAKRDPVAILSSPWSGIRVTVFSEQEAFQIYSCEGQNGTRPIKATQGLPGRARVVQKGGCVVMEVEDWIDGINHPEWRRKQIYAPGEEYVLTARYEFDLL